MLKTLLIIHFILIPIVFSRPRSDFDIFEETQQKTSNPRGSRSSEIMHELLENSRRGGDLEHVDHEMEKMNLVVEEIQCEENSRINLSKLKDLTEQIRKSNSMSRKMGSEFRKENRSILRRLQKMILANELQEL